MPVPNRISIITLGVENLPASAAFYERLGWSRAASSNDQIVCFPTADSVLGLYPRDALAEDCGLPNTPSPTFGGTTLAINVAAGAYLLRAAERAEWGGYRGYFADPDGYPWEVAYNPCANFDENGSLVVE